MRLLCVRVGDYGRGAAAAARLRLRLGLGLGLGLRPLCVVSGQWSRLRCAR
jgi:hypothetical protein